MQNTISRDAKRILVMDDEASIREVVSRMLAAYGHICITAANGEEAVTLFDRAYRNNTPFDLTIVDLAVANGEGGIWALQCIRAIAPQAKVVLTSGAAQETLERSQHLGFHDVLPKPFRIDELLRLLN